MSTGRKEMVAALNKLFVPELRLRGFKGSFPHFRRTIDGFTSLITFQFDRYGGGFVVELAKWNSDPFVTHWGKEISLKKLTAHDLNIRQRIYPDTIKEHGKESWFRYDKNRWFSFGNKYEKLANKAVSRLSLMEEYWDDKKIQLPLLPKDKLKSPVNEKAKTALELLSNSKSKKRESGAKQLRKLQSVETGPHLLEALERELLDSRTWSTQYHLILALGHSNYDQALPFLMELAKRQFDATILYMGLGDSIFRLSLKSRSLDTTLKHILAYKNYMLTCGAFRALALLRSIPDDDLMINILSVASDPKATEFVRSHPKDKTGLRYWIAVASAGWKDDLKSEFLTECDSIKDTRLSAAVESSRKGKYMNLNPY